MGVGADADAWVELLGFEAAAAVTERVIRRVGGTARKAVEVLLAFG